MTDVNPLGVAAVVLGGVLIGVGILLVVAGFIITAIESRRPVPPGPKPESDFFDFMIELAKRIQLIYIPGILLIAIGVFLVGIVVVGADPFVGDDSEDTPAATPIVSPSPATSATPS